MTTQTNDTCINSDKQVLDNSTKCRGTSSLHDDLQKWTILAGVAILFLLLVVNTVSVIQRRKNHRSVERYLLSLVALFPFGRNYNDIVSEEQDPDIKVISKRGRDCRIATDYDEIEIVGNPRYESNDAKESKSLIKTQTERETETEVNSKTETVCGDSEGEERCSLKQVQSRDSMYSLQREVLSSNL